MSHIVPGDTPEEIAQRRDERIQEEELARVRAAAERAAANATHEEKNVNVVRVTLVVILVLSVIAMVVYSS